MVSFIVAAERCSFCGLGASPGRRLVTGEGGIAICRGCAELAVDVLDETVGDAEPDIVLTGVSGLVTMDSRRGGLLGVERDVLVAIRRGRIVWIGSEAELPRPYRDLPELDCGGRVVLPGMVDAAAMLLGGPPTGRPDPVSATDRATGGARGMLRRGVTSIDLRTGGGIEPTTETLLLAVARSVGERLPMQISVTWRCAPDFPAASLREVMVPTAARLASFSLVECTGDEQDLADRLSVVRPLRHRLVCHEPEPEACLGILDSSVSVEGVPAHALGPDGPTPIVPWWEPAQAVGFWRSGLRPAIATYSDPAGRYLGGMGVVLMTAVDLAGLSVEQALWSVTRGGALASADAERGWVHLGGPADLVVLDGEALDDLVRNPDGDMAWRVLVGGVEIA